MKTPNKYTLILFILFNILFISNIFTKEINNNSNNDIDFSKYYLKGLFSKKCFPEIDKDYCDTQHFYMYDNKIYLISEFEDIIEKKIPDGTYTLTTDNKSKVNITVNNGVVTNFKLLSSKKKFIKKEEKIKDDDYCKIGFEYLVYQYLYNQDFYKSIRNNSITAHSVDDENLYREYSSQIRVNFFKYKNKLLAIYNDNHCFFPNEKELNIKFYEYLELYTKLALKNPLKIKKSFIFNYTLDNPDIIIKNCIVEYYNKDVLPLEFE